MWPDSEFETKRESAGPGASRHTGTALQDYPDQEAIDYYLAKASVMRSRQFRRYFSIGWRALHRIVRRQLSPCRRVKLPPTAA